MKNKMKFYAVCFKGSNYETSFFRSYDSACRYLTGEGYGLLHARDGHTYSCDVWVYCAENSDFGSFFVGSEAKIVEHVFQD